MKSGEVGADWLAVRLNLIEAVVAEVSFLCFEAVLQYLEDDVVI